MIYQNEVESIVLCNKEYILSAFLVTVLVNSYRLFVCQDEKKMNPKTKVFVCSR